MSNVGSRDHKIKCIWKQGAQSEIDAGCGSPSVDPQLFARRRAVRCISLLLGGSNDFERAVADCFAAEALVLGCSRLLASVFL